MAKLKIKRAVSFVMATVLSLTAFMGVGANTAFAAAGEKTNVYMVDFPRDGDANYDGVWGYSNLTLKNGWHTGSATHTNLKAIGSFSGNVGYCIEPGVHLSMGQSMTQYDENYFNNIQANGVISGDEIRQYIGRILQYGYRGTISTSWRSQNEAAANSIAHAYATQLLIWETIVGERDANFNHKAASGCSNVKDVVNAAHPLRSKIFSYYDSMVASIQKHTVVPSFCNRSAGSAKTLELEWDGSKYTTTLTDANNVLSNYSFSANISGVSFSTNGNKLTVSMEKAPSDTFTITASKKNSVRRGVVVWSEGKHGTGSSVQDVVSYAQEVGDPVSGYVKMKVSYGSCQIVKTSEDGKVDGINFTISGNGINQTVTTANTDWTVREITPSEGYLLDKTIHKVGADPKLYEVEHENTTERSGKNERDHIHDGRGLQPSESDLARTAGAGGGQMVTDEENISQGRDLVSELDVKIILMALSESVGARLRENGFQCRTVEISIRDNGLYHFTRQCKLDRASNLTEEIARTAFELFQKNYNWEHPIRSLGVRGCDLVSEEMPYQLDLFMDETKREKIKKMDQVVDEIRGRFGYQSIQRAFMYQDKILAQLNAKEHTVHPQAYFHG